MPQALSRCCSIYPTVSTQSPLSRPPSNTVRLPGEMSNKLQLCLDFGWIGGFMCFSNCDQISNHRPCDSYFFKVFDAEAGQIERGPATYIYIYIITYGSEVWKRGMEQRYGTDPSRRYGTGVWNGGMERVWSRSLFRTSYFDLPPYGHRYSLFSSDTERKSCK